MTARTIVTATVTSVLRFCVEGVITGVLSACLIGNSILKKAIAETSPLRNIITALLKY